MKASFLFVVLLAAEIFAQARTEAQAPAQSRTQAAARRQTPAKSQTQAQGQAQSQTEAQTQTPGQAQVQAQTEAQTEAPAKSRTQVQTQTKVQTKTQSQPQAPGGSNPDTLAYRELVNRLQREFAPDKRDSYVSLRIKADSVILESTEPRILAEFEQQGPAGTGLHIQTELLPSAALNGKYYGVTNISVANNRSSTQHSAELMTQMLLGTPVQVLKRQNGFYLVRSPDHYLAWVDGGGIKLMTAQEWQNWKQQPKVIFTAGSGYVYSQADAKAVPVSDVVSGNLLALKGEQADFYQVAFPDGRQGYLRKAEAQTFKSWLNRPNPKAEAILSAAYTLMGAPYLWGGTSVKGVDCSGFTKTAYFLNGIIIPRDASQQALVGEPVDVLEKDTISLDKCLKNLQPGDLLFFSAAKIRGINGGKITHTAIYIGNGRFIQSAGRVQISSLLATAPDYDERESRTLVGARRMLNAIGTAKISRVDQHPWYQ